MPSTTPPGVGMGGYPVPSGMITSQQSLGPSLSQHSLGPTVPQTGGSTFHDPTQVGAYTSAESPYDVKLAPDFTIHVTKLLDIPIPTGATSHFIGRNQVYFMEVYDEEMNKVLATSDKIQGHVSTKDSEEDCHTLELGREGDVKVKSSARVIHLELKREGFLGNEVIGQCTISRLDPRSPSVHRYALTHEEHGAHCGIELQVVEPKFNPGANIHKDPATMPEKQKQDMHAPIINNGYVAMIVIDKVSDLPAPAKGMKPEIFISFEADEKDHEEHELERAGPFKVEPSPQNPKLRSSFVRKTSGVRAPLRVGGTSGEGSMYLRIQVSYASGHKQLEAVGISEVIQVRINESAMTYYEIKPRHGSTPVGGIQLKHRLVTEDTWKRISRELGLEKGAAKKVEKKEYHVDVTKPGGNIQLKQQLMNTEAQNRADYQRYKQHLPAGKIPGESKEAGYRVWNSMEAMFTSMGPHPLAGGDSVGPRVVRGYEEDKKDFDGLQRALQDRTSRVKPKTRQGAQLNKKEAPKGSKEDLDPFLDPEVSRLMYDGDPDEVTHRLRPNICKDPDEIAREKDIKWIQNSQYIPIRNMSAEDRETLRLAQYTREQDSKMNFYDVVPHYRINEDIWGVAAEAKAVKSSLMRPPGANIKRVKDECIMA